jgi:glycosyltransferase involved in cell wall biosynthesis
MRILKVHNYYTSGGGEDTVFLSESALLRSQGHEVFEFLEHNSKIESMNKAIVALNTIWSRPSYLRMKEYLIETRPDVVHFHNTFPMISPSAYYACRDVGIPVVQTLDNQRLMCPASSFYRDGKLCLDCLGKTPPFPGIVHGCYHNSHLHTAVVASLVTFHHWMRTWQTKINAFLCSTNFYRDLFVQAGFPADKIVVMPHFVPSPQNIDFTTTTREYALFVGRLDPEKGVRTLIEAWRHLNIPLRIRGSGKLENELREYVSRYDMNHIEFVERLDDQQLSALIGNARFLIMPSEGYYETFGMVIVEAFSRSVPVIASNIGVVSELVADGQTGLLFNAGDSVDLANKARWLWDHPLEAQNLGQSGNIEYQMRFTAERCYRTLIALYEKLAGSK